MKIIFFSIQRSHKKIAKLGFIQIIGINSSTIEINF
jgi:hypothetical protein